MAKANEPLTLRECNEGDIVKVKRILPGPIARRLREMGFIPDATVEIVKYAPLKDPIEVVVMGYHVSLRLDEAEWIEVERTGRKSAS